MKKLLCLAIVLCNFLFISLLAIAESNTIDISNLIDRKKIGLKDAIIALQISAGQIIVDNNICDENKPYKCKTGECVSSPVECLEDKCPNDKPYKCSNSKCVSEPSECISSIAIHWNGPGGDMWNTNSSPYDVDPNEPFNILWASKSDDGDYFRPSGLVLADIGVPKTQYIFGSAGWGQNRVYRRFRGDGSSSNWLSQNTENDSGTGFRIAISPDGNTIYHIDVGNTIRAFKAIDNPNGQPLWSKNYVSNSKGIKYMIKIGPDGRIYGHYNGTVALNPQTGDICWETNENLEQAEFPGVFFKTNHNTLYIVSGLSRIISAYDIQSESGADPIWSFTDSETGHSSPTVDPKNGDIYIFRRTRVIKLSISGKLVWESNQIDSGEYRGRIHGALSRDATTYYYQTGGSECSGKLYAFNAIDGSLKWKFKTNARASDYFGSPVVSNNSMIFVGNGSTTFIGGGGSSDSNNQIFCIKDAGQNNPVLIDILDLHDHNDNGSPHIAIGPGGVVYLDGCIDVDNSTSATSYLFAFKSNVDNTYQKENIVQKKFNIPILSIAYFPDENNDGKLDKDLVGGDSADFPVTQMKQKVSELTDGLIDTLEYGSRYHGYKDETAINSLNYTIIEHKNIDAPIPLSDNFIPFADHIMILNDLNICDYVDNKGVKEVWIWMYHSSVVAPIESNMSSPYGDISNSYRHDDLPHCQSTYTVYNYNYGRGVSEATENHMHQIEAVLRYVDEDLFWNKFVGPVGTQEGDRRCGWTHYPPNGISDYDWTNNNYVTSDCENWRPDEIGSTEIFNCEKWNCNSLDFFEWWMQNIPGIDNNLTYYESKLKNWWIFIGDFDQAMVHGKSLFE